MVRRALSLGLVLPGMGFFLLLAAQARPGMVRIGEAPKRVCAMTLLWEECSGVRGELGTSSSHKSGDKSPYFQIRLRQLLGELGGGNGGGGLEVQPEGLGQIA